jgi:hypothetical protein
MWDMAVASGQIFRRIKANLKKNSSSSRIVTGKLCNDDNDVKYLNEFRR